MKRGDLMGKRKGQITIYMIIGIIALISVSIFFYIRTVKVDAPESYSPTIEQIPLEAEPIREFVESCLGQIAEDGLRNIGDYGGYISREEIGGFANPLSPTTSDAVQFSPDSELVVPYWWHLESDNDCEKRGKCSFSSKRPNLLRAHGGKNIEEQLDEYVNEHLKDCLMGFVDLRDYGFVISEKGKVDTTTVITKHTVAFKVSYPIVAEKADVKYQINDYFVDIPINLEEIYKLASSLADLQVEYQFLEEYTLSLMDMFSALDESRIPPFSATGFDSGGGLMWSKSEIKEQIDRIMVAYMPMLQVVDTKNYRPIVFSEGEGNSLIKRIFYNNLMLIPLMNQSHPSLEVKFMYLDWWNSYFNINCEGELCKSQSVSGVGQIMFFLQRYEFLYDYSIPVLVSIVNPHAFMGKGYSFKFFMESNVRDNKALNTTGIGTPFDVGELPPVGKSMLCDANKRTSELATIIVTDAFSGDGLDEVMVSYTCGSETCQIGMTGYQGILETKFPMCAGGQIQMNKQGYLPVTGGLSTSTKGDPFTLQVTMSPFREKDIVVKKYLIKKQLVNFDWAWVAEQNSLSLSSKEEAVVTLSRVPSPGEGAFSVVAEYTGNRALADLSKKVKIVPGDYDVEISLIYRGDLTIPTKERCEGGFIGIGETCFTLDAIDFTEKKPLYEGGLSREGMHFSAVDIDSNDKIILHAIAIDLPGASESSRVHEDLEQVNNIKTYSKNYGDLVNPQYEKYDEVATRQNRTVILE